MKSIPTLLLVGGLFLLPSARAASVSIPILDVNTSGDYTSDPSQTSPFTGFFGMYNEVAVGSPTIAHLFGVEQSDFSRTVAQVDLGFLNGATISSASLTFLLLFGGGTQDVQLTTFDSVGLLQYTWDAPGVNLGQGVYSSTAGGANSFDVTALIQNAANLDIDWLGLHFQGTDQYQWTYTGTGLDADAALLRLNIEYTDRETPVPEVQTYASLFGAALVCAEAFRRRRALRARA
jgi:hypothetical protein